MLRMQRTREYFLYRIENFSPSWFAMTMGVGMAGSLLVDYPYPAEYLRRLGIAFWGTGTVLFVIFTIFTVLRLLLFPSKFKMSLLHPTQSLYWGCMPMGLCPIITDAVGIFGAKAVWACYVLWWIDVVLALLCAWLMVFVGFARNTRLRPADLNAVILLPVVTLVLCASTGSILVEYLPDNWRPHMIILCALCWGNGELLAFLFTGVYVWRLLTHGLPARESVTSCFLPIGPLGQGAYGFLINAVNLENYLTAHDYPALASVPVFKYIGCAVAIFMVGLATFWLVMAVFACIYHRPRVFGLGWWGLTFPPGTYALATRQLGEVLDIEGFRVVSALVGTAVVFIVFFLILTTFYYGVVRPNAFKAAETELSGNVEKVKRESESDLTQTDMV
ncbi:voltage-dependent anion channel [Myxozyma melibiosi]|uniref:Voltage-dependent anion channel n=1 Tax=Myxozyma melibiosi TaxID=54550 RepID=A0ABR1F7V6_9ASCO